MAAKRLDGILARHSRPARSCGQTYTVKGGDGNYKIALGAGNDTVTINGNGGSTITAGAGDDIIKINGSGVNTIHLGAKTAAITLSGSNNNIDFDGKVMRKISLQTGFKENINGFISGDVLDLINIGDVTFSAALTSAGVSNPGEVDLYKNGGKIRSLFFNCSVAYDKLKPISDGAGGTKIVLDLLRDRGNPVGTQIHWRFVQRMECPNGKTELALYFSTGFSGLTMPQGVDIGDQGNAVSYIGGLLSSWGNDPNVAFISKFINKTHAQALALLAPRATVGGNPASIRSSLTTTQETRSQTQ